MEGVKTDDLIEEARVFFIGAVAEHHFDAIVIAVLHLLHPEFAGGDAVGVCEQDDLVPGLLDPHAEGIFFTGNADGFLFEVNDMESFEGLFKFIQQEAGVILAIVVNNDNLMGAGVGLDQGAGEMGDQFGCFVACADDYADGVLLRLFFFCGDKKSQTSEEPPIIKKLDQGDQEKHYKNDLSPGDTQFSHKHSTKRFRPRIRRRMMENGSDF